MVPRSGPHWPTVIMIHKPPARFEPVALVFALQTRIMDTVTKMLTVRKRPAYRAATDVAVPRMVYPTAASKAKKLANGPRSRRRSEINDVPITTRKHSRYGGAERPFD